MAKRPTITTVITGFQSGTTINANLEALRDGFDNTLSLDGSAPNAMGADLDMNSNDILNAGTVNTTELKVGGSTFVPGDAVGLYTPDWEGAWLTSTAYLVNDLVRENGNVYICLVDHTSGTFATDLAAGKWELFASKGDSGLGTGDLLASNNLSDLADADTALANLGGGTVGIAIFKGTTAAAVRTELGLGNIATTDLIDEDDMASDLDTRAPTQQSVKAYVDAIPSGIGVGQTWQNVTGSRAAGTAYQNTTGKPIMVHIQSASSSTTGLSISTTGAYAGEQVEVFTGDSSGFTKTISVIVPDDHYYRLDSGGSFGNWSELR